MRSKTKSSYTIVGLGEVLWDIYRDQRHLGGAPANFAIHAHQLGDTGILVSRVGDDGMGRELLRALKQRKLSTDFIQIDKKKGTGTVLITLDIKGVPNFSCTKDVAFDHLKWIPELAELAASADAVVFGSLAQRSTAGHQTIQEFLAAAKKAVKVFDVNSRAAEPELLQILPDSLAVANILKMSLTEMETMRRALRRDGDTLAGFVDFLFSEYDLSLIAVTFGENGCELFNGRETCRLPGLPVKVVDTTGSGDAFAAGMVYKFLRGAPLREIAEFANTLGAYLCTVNGATPAFTAEDLEVFRQSMILRA